ncbi:hypothetical protein MTP99_007656 [Tenebrio molitor]|nr:hypothetical protein MTP99_007656 [Tenebrio molitor]
MKPVVDVTRQWIEFTKNTAGDGPDAYLSPWSDLSHHLGHTLEDNFGQARDRLLRSLGAGAALSRVSPPRFPRTTLGCRPRGPVTMTPFLVPRPTTLGSTLMRPGPGPATSKFQLLG